MLTVLAILSWSIALPLAFLFGVFTVEVLVGLISTKKGSGEPDAGVRTTILIPAHNEALGIGKTLQNLSRQLPESADIMVVADNCSDETAATAREQGVAVVERSDTAARGKGYALAYGRDSLSVSPPECVIVLDADCSLEPGSIEYLAKAALDNGAPVQAINLIRAEGLAPPTVQISNFAMLVKNLVRQRGMTRLGGPALLTGTGMAFPWKIFADAPLASADLAEDLALGVHFTHQGIKPRFVEQANVWSASAAEQDTLEQRTRWEHGFLSTARKFALPLLLSGMRHFDQTRLLLGLHLLVPPLALLFMIGAAVLIVLLLLVYLGVGTVPTSLLAITLCAATSATLAAWAKEGRAMLTGSALLRIPLYVLWKIPVYLKLVNGPEKQWVRTRRSGEDPPDR